jgi:hypothetical protein
MGKEAEANERMEGRMEWNNNERTGIELIGIEVIKRENKDERKLKEKRN